MKLQMFVNEVKQDGRSPVSLLKNKYFDLIDEINVLLKEQNYSVSELYQIIIYKGLLKPTYLKEFVKIVRWGVRQGLINPDVLVSKRVKGRRLPNFFVKEQWVKFFRNCEDPRTAMTCFIAFKCGLRPSEVVKLRKSHLDFDGKRCKIIQSKGSKDRIVPLLEDTHSIIKKWIKYANVNDYLFPSEESHSVATENKPYLSLRTMTNGFREVLRKIGLDQLDERYKNRRRKYTFYVWRHSFATYWISKEVSPAFIKEAMGHAKIDTTINVYTHIEHGTIVKTMEKFTPKKVIETVPEKDSNIHSVIAQRFAKGEINKEEAMEMKQFLGDELIKCP